MIQLARRSFLASIASSVITSGAEYEDVEILDLYSLWRYDPIRGRSLESFSTSRWRAVENTIRSDDFRPRIAAVRLAVHLLEKDKVPESEIRRRLLPLVQYLEEHATVSGEALLFQVERLRFLGDLRVTSLAADAIDVIVNRLAIRSDDAMYYAHIAPELLREISYADARRVLSRAASDATWWVEYRRALELGVERLRLSQLLEAATGNDQRNEIARKWLKTEGVQEAAVEGATILAIWILEEVVRLNGVDSTSVLRHTRANSELRRDVRRAAEDYLVDLGIVASTDRIFVEIE